MLDLNYNTVRVTLFRGMEQLREIYRALERVKILKIQMK